MILLDVISVTPREDYTLELVFENGEKRILDMNPFLSQKPFIRLSGSPLFFQGIRPKRDGCLAGEYRYRSRNCW